jgi:hypothetical protein
MMTRFLGTGGMSFLSIAPAYPSAKRMMQKKKGALKRRLSMESRIPPSRA